MHAAEEETLLSFPCSFPIKAMGKAEPGFDMLIVGLIREYAPDIHAGAVKSRLSHGGKFVSVTVTIEAQSKSQLDFIYQSLTDHDKVIMAL